MRWLALVAVLLLSACASLTPEGRQRDRERDQVAALLAYNQGLAALPAEDQQRAFVAAQQAFAREGSDDNRLRLAFAWCLPNAPWRDDPRLLKLLDESPSLAAAESSPLRHLTLFMRQEVGERLQEERRLEATLRDERRRHEAQAREDKRTTEELQRKLDSLLAIDRDLAHRHGRKPAAPTPP